VADCQGLLCHRSKAFSAAQSRHGFEIFFGRDTAVEGSFSINRWSTPGSQSQRDCVTQPTGCEAGPSGSDRATLGHASETGASLKGLNLPVRDVAGGNGCNPFQGC